MINTLKNLEKNFSVGKAAALIGFFTIFSRLTGFVRSALFASLLGPGDKLDIYYAAFRIPDLVFNLMILGTLSVSFIPVFVDEFKKNSKNAYKIANSVMNCAVAVMVVICGSLAIFAPELVKMLTPGFYGEKFWSTVFLTRLLLITPVLFTISSILSSILNSQKKFLAASLSPILYNLGIIFGFLYLFPKFGFLGWGLGVILGSLLHIAAQIPQVISLGYKYQAIILFKETALKKIFLLFLPRIFGIDLANVSLIIATIVGSTLTSGTISIFNLALDLAAVPLGIFGYSVSVAAFPALSQYYAERNFPAFFKTLEDSTIKVLFFLIPISVLLFLMRSYVVRLGFGRGEFDWNDTRLTFTALGIFCFSLFSQGVMPLFARAFYATQNTKIPVFANSIAIAINICCAYVFTKIYAFALPGLAAAFTIASISGFTVLFFLLRQRLKGFSDVHFKVFNAKILSSALKIICASFILAEVSYLSLKIIGPLVDTQTATGILFQSITSSAVGIAAFIFVAIKLKLREAEEIWRMLKKNE